MLTATQTQSWLTFTCSHGIRLVNGSSVYKELFTEKAGLSCGAYLAESCKEQGASRELLWSGQAQIWWGKEQNWAANKATWLMRSWPQADPIRLKRESQGPYLYSMSPSHIGSQRMLRLILFVLRRGTIRGFRNEVSLPGQSSQDR